MKHYPLRALNRVLLASLVSMAGFSTVHAQHAMSQTATQGTVLTLPADEVNSAPPILPTRSMSKAGVQREFGTPQQRFPAVGEPPITRWDYSKFRVFFEYDKVLHAVVPGDFPSVTHSDQLSRAR